MFVHRYVLPLRRGGAREGALLPAGDGFADVHPWPELLENLPWKSIG
jgi:hypothetical protein